MNLAPIVLFTYRKLKELKMTVESLIKCREAKESDLYIFCDGAKNEKDSHNVDMVRDYIDKLAMAGNFKSVTVIKSDVNKGLANSVITGVSEILSQHESVIVLEDDLLLSPSFLAFMNKALHFYKDDKRIGSVTGHSFPIDLGIAEDIGLSLRFSAWGWGIWKDRWQGIDWDMSYYDELMTDEKQVAQLNQAGSDMADIMRAQHDGLVDTWDIQVSYWLMKKGQFTVFPVQTLVINTGFGESSTHCKNPMRGYDKMKICDRELTISHVEPKPEIFEKLREYFSQNDDIKLRLEQHGCGQKEKTIIYGTGNWGKKLYEILAAWDYQIVAYTDSDQGKWGQSIYGLKIIPPSMILNTEFDHVLIASSKFEEIRKSLLELGIVDKNVIVFDFM